MIKKSKSKKNKQVVVHSVTSLVAFIIIIVLLSSLITLLLFNIFHEPKPAVVEVLPYDFTVTNSVSFVLETDKLHFGGGPLSARLERGMNLSTSQDSLVKISWDGPGNIMVSDNDFLLSANTPKDITFYLDIPDDLSLGNYSGKIIFKFYR